MRKLLMALSAAALVSLGATGYAEEDALCLDCHEPAEDWDGMTVDEIIEHATDTSIKRHADNAELGAEELKAMVEALLADS